MPQRVLDLLKEAAKANLADKFRSGNKISLPPQGTLVIAGDIHGHRRNFERIINFADLENNPECHVVLQEIIHGGQIDECGDCVSYKLLFDAAEYKLKFPDRVHILMSNHDTATITDSEVMKQGRKMNISMRAAIDREYGLDGPDIMLAIEEFLFSEPLAIKCENGIWASHSLPSDRFLDKFETDIFDRPLKKEDLVKPGSVYLLTWGRRHSQDTLDRMAEMLNAEVFILGHQTDHGGCGKAGNNLIIINSEQNHGCLMKADLSRHYEIDELMNAVLPIASIQ
jgi:hypothetical protein